MMKRYLALILVGLAGLPAFGQQMADYYQLPNHHNQYDRLLTRYGGAYTRDRWYVSLDGFVRADRAKLDNSFGSLIESDRVTKLGWSALIGWAYREKWAIEGGYANSPIHTEVLVYNGRYSPYTFRYTNERHSLVLRGKRLIASTSGPWRRSGFWLTGGLLLTPNSGLNRGSFALAGYSYAYNDRPGALDTLRLTGQTTTNTRPTAVLETGVEYNLRLNNRLDMGVSFRKLWGLSNSITTDLTYVVNNRDIQQAQLRGTGNGMSVGLSLRYTYAVRRTLSNVLGVQGKRGIGQ